MDGIHHAIRVANGAKYVHFVGYTSMQWKTITVIPYIDMCDVVATLIVKITL